MGKFFPFVFDTVSRLENSGPSPGKTGARIAKAIHVIWIFNS